MTMSDTSISMPGSRTHAGRATEPHTTPRRKLLIIDDDPIVRVIYRDNFLKANYDVELAENGPAGLERLESFQPDAVLLDLVLPEMHGLKVLESIRSSPAH